MKTYNFNLARVELIQHLAKLNISDADINDVVELSLRMSNGLVSDIRHNINATLDLNIKSVGAYNYRLPNEQ